MRNSKWFKEGIDAARSSKGVELCPYGARSAKALIWLEGHSFGTAYPDRSEQPQ